MLTSVAFLFVSVTTYSFYTVKEYIASKKPISSSTSNLSSYTNKNLESQTAKIQISSSLIPPKANSSLPLQSISVQSIVTKTQTIESSQTPKTLETIEVKVLEKTQQPEKIQDIKIENSLPIPTIETKIETTKIVNKYKTLEGNQWKELYEKAKLSYQNTKSDYGGLDYFGDPALNKIATDIALERGFVKRSIVADESQMVYVEGYPIQKLMADQLTALFKEMRDDGHPIILLSAHRGIVEQSQVFGQEFTKQSFLILGHEASNEEILNRKADVVISKTLETVALPGYSRHHLGYTIDVTESGTYYKDFEKTASYEWMSKDNFANLKKYGIIPSYPKGVQYQGPEPESWEFVYVGTDILKV